MGKSGETARKLQVHFAEVALKLKTRYGKKNISGIQLYDP